jgi:aspartyl-tRNA(Asn)/glutamyl-tRNA(Gln) amidotransferase subunit B
MDQLGIQQVSSDELTDLCRQLLAANPQVVDDVKNGKQKAIGSLIGQAKKQNPNANPGQVREICLQLIDEM